LFGFLNGFFLSLPCIAALLTRVFPGRCCECHLVAGLFPDRCFFWPESQARSAFVSFFVPSPGVVFLSTISLTFSRIFFIFNPDLAPGDLFLENTFRAGLSRGFWLYSFFSPVRFPLSFSPIVSVYTNRLCLSP